MVPVSYRCREPITLNGSPEAAQAKYRYFSEGPLSSNGGEAAVFHKTRPELLMPDLQIVFFPGSFSDPLLSGHGFTFWSIALPSESRGQVQLGSSDPLKAPVIQPNYLAAESDLNVLVHGMTLARRLARTKAFAPFTGEEVSPGAGMNSSKDYNQFIRSRLTTMFHPVGTCRLGWDRLAVVSPSLQVHGVEALRVADASVMPVITNGNTLAPTIMIAEKAADMIIGRSPVTTRLGRDMACAKT